MHRIPTAQPVAAKASRGAPPRAADEDDGKTVEGEGQVGTATKTRTRPKKPSQYKVLMLNDDYTPMEFVVMCLKRFFRMDLEQATRVMLHVHQRGVGVCGRLSLRGRRDQGEPGDGLRPARTSTRCNARSKKPDLSRGNGYSRAKRTSARAVDLT
jgi:ATP-dependent Clp protease adaptor protein ClpS